MKIILYYSHLYSLIKHQSVQAIQFRVEATTRCVPGKLVHSFELHLRR